MSRLASFCRARIAKVSRGYLILQHSAVVLAKFVLDCAVDLQVSRWYFQVKGSCKKNRWVYAWFLFARKMHLLPQAVGWSIECTVAWPSCSALKVGDKAGQSWTTKSLSDTPVENTINGPERWWWSSTGSGGVCPAPWPGQEAHDLFPSHAPCLALGILRSIRHCLSAGYNVTKSQKDSYPMTHCWNGFSLLPIYLKTYICNYFVMLSVSTSETFGLINLL